MGYWETQGGLLGGPVSRLSSTVAVVFKCSALIPDILPKSSTEEDLAVRVAVSPSMDDPSVNRRVHGVGFLFTAVVVHKLVIQWFSLLLFLGVTASSDS